MTRIFAFAAALAVSMMATAADQISFEGRDYQLAKVGVAGAEITNQYLPKGGTPERWETAVMVRMFKGKASTEEVVAQYVKASRPSLADEPLMLPHGGKDDAVLVLFQKTPDKGQVEYSVQCFRRGADGVIVHGFAQRLPRDGDLTQVLARQPTRVDQLFALKVPAKEKM